MRLPPLHCSVQTTDPRRLRIKTGLRSGGNRLFDSQNQHYLHADESFDV